MVLQRENSSDCIRRRKWRKGRKRKRRREKRKGHFKVYVIYEIYMYIYTNPNAFHISIH